MKMRFKRFLSGFMAVATLASVIIQPVAVSASELEPEEIIAIYLRRWQIESLFKQLKQNFPLRYFFGESVNAIKTQIWVTLIANLLLSVIRKRIRHKWSFSNLVTMIRQTLMYYIDLYMFCEDPEKAWLKIINHSNLSPPEPTLFD